MKENYVWKKEEPNHEKKHIKRTNVTIPPDLYALSIRIQDNFQGYLLVQANIMLSYTSIVTDIFLIFNKSIRIWNDWAKTIKIEIALLLPCARALELTATKVHNEIDILNSHALSKSHIYKLTNMWIYNRKEIFSHFHWCVYAK